MAASSVPALPTRAPAYLDIVILYQGNLTGVARKAISANDLDQNLGLLVQEVSLLMRKHFNRLVREMGLTAPQWQVLAELYREQGITQTELADALVMAKSPLGKLLDKLERTGLIERRNDKLDRRAKRIHLTQSRRPTASLELLFDLGKVVEIVFHAATRAEGVWISCLFETAPVRSVFYRPDRDPRSFDQK